MNNYKIILTGVSRGLGQDLLHVILKNNPEYQVIGTVRTEADNLTDQLKKQYPNSSVKIMKLDIYNMQSVDEFASNLKNKKYEFDCLINNAAVGCDYGTQLPSVETADKTLTTNVLGTIHLTHSLLPLLSKNGRIINVSSKLGGLVFQGNQVKQKYSNDNMTLQWLQNQAKNYIQNVKKGNSGIYSKSAYGTSKMMLNAWARFILKKQLKGNQVVICMSPGHCQTDMGGRDRAPRTSMQGAQTIYSHITGQRHSDIFYSTEVKSDFIAC